MTTTISSKAIGKSVAAKILSGALFMLLMTLGSIGTGGLSLNNAQAQGYETINPPLNTSDQENVEVVEFFWFGCPHCYAFEPSIDEWAANVPENAIFLREAPPLNPSWEAHSQAFYASQILGISDKFVPAMFNAIHKEKKRMRKPCLLYTSPSPRDRG